MQACRLGRERQTRMSTHVVLPDPSRFGLSHFRDILPERIPLPGEEPASFQVFHAGLIHALAPITPYECIIAENLVNIEWELLQHWRVRQAELRRASRKAILDAVVKSEQERHEQALYEAFDAFIEDGGDRNDWEDPFFFDQEAAEKVGENIAAAAVSDDLTDRTYAEADLAERGIDVLDVLSKAYGEFNIEAIYHDAKLKELERRRREVMRDYELLQKARPIEAEAIRE